MQSIITFLITVTSPQLAPADLEVGWMLDAANVLVLLLMCILSGVNKVEEGHVVVSQSFGHRLTGQLFGCLFVWHFIYFFAQ